MTEDEMVGWHHLLDVHESEQTLGDSEGQGNLACCSPWGCKVLDTTERLNNKDLDLALPKLSPKESSAFLTCFATGSVPTLAPAHRKIPFPHMNTYSDLLLHRLCLLD